MASQRRIWLVSNQASGSNADDALTALEDCCGKGGLRVAFSTVFPERELPTPAVLDAAGIDLVAVFAGDGTINTLLVELAGWGGQVLVLPGGTMNLLYHRLHGDREMEEVVERVAAGRAESRRPGVIRCPGGMGYAGVLAGPGTSWNHVREAMRGNDLLQFAGEAGEAIEKTLEGEPVVCADPQAGRQEGYPLLMLTPYDDGIEIAAFHAETTADYLQQTLALMRRNFRDGPHEVLGRHATIRLAGAEGGTFGLLIDGEPADSLAMAEFALVPCNVDLLATGPDAR